MLGPMVDLPWREESAALGACVINYRFHFHFLLSFLLFFVICVSCTARLALAAHTALKASELSRLYVKTVRFDFKSRNFRQNDTFFKRCASLLAGLLKIVFRDFAQTLTRVEADRAFRASFSQRLKGCVLGVNLAAEIIFRNYLSARRRLL